MDERVWSCVPCSAGVTRRSRKRFHLPFSVGSMTRQLDLLGHAGLELEPEAGRSEPRLWVRRLVIWSEPGVMLRELHLRPGLNIIWAPDPADRVAASGGGNTVGHGSGKTMFCRLLRYCLGEDRFAPAEQRARIAGAFPQGRVGAEVMLDGVCWSVVRPIGAERRHLAIRDAELSQVTLQDDAASGLTPFLDAVVAAFLPGEVATLVPGENPANSWLVALAWLSRDQECRFDKLLEWRSPDSDSESPARKLALQHRRDALRKLIGAVVPEEFELRAELDKLEVNQRSLGQEASRLEWATSRLRAGLVEELGLDPEDLLPGRMAIEPLRAAAKSSLTRLAGVEPDAHASDLDALRSEFDGARPRVEAMQSRQSALQERIPEIEKLVSRINGEMPGASARANSLASPICPICEVPIDRALAQGCKLSHKLPNLEEARRRVETLNADHTEESRRLAESRQELARTRRDLDSARRQADAAHGRLREVERVRDARSDAWFRARRVVDDVARLDQLLAEHERAQSRAGSLDQEIQAKRDRTAAFRDAQAGVFDSLSRFFNAIIRAVMHVDAVGKISFDGSGLEASVELGGERSTAAIDSLKVIAFDLAVLCMSIEGRTHLPAFLVHDSPREADLGLSVYHRLFDLARRLEETDASPLFQYIVTTTTSPPDDACTEPWLAVTLGGAAEARLMKRDL